MIFTFTNFTRYYCSINTSIFCNLSHWIKERSSYYINANLLIIISSFN